MRAQQAVKLSPALWIFYDILMLNWLAVTGCDWLRHDVKIADFGLSKCLKRVGEQDAGDAASGLGGLFCVLWIAYLYTQNNCPFMQMNE